MEVSEELMNEVEDINSSTYSKIQEGIKIEHDSAQIYEQMSAFADSHGFKNTKKWFKTHAQEERKHSDWVISFLEDKGEMPELPEVAKPEIDYENIEEMLEAAYEHEEFVTKFWNKAASHYCEAGDHDTYQFCLFVLKEQREEIDLFSGLLDLYKLADGNMIEFDKNMIHP